MSGSNTNSNDATPTLQFRSSVVNTGDGLIRDGNAVYSNTIIAGGIVNIEKQTENGPPPISHWRQAKISDIPKIERLITEYSIQVFGHINLELGIERTILTLVQINEEDEIILFISFSRRTQLPAVCKSATPDFLESNYGLPFLKESGTYVIRLLLWDDRYTGDTLRYVLRSLFNSQQEVHFVLMLLPGKVPVLNAIGVKNVENVQTIHICHRESVLGRVHTRIAQGPEGIRDATRIFDHYASLIQQKFGYFCMRELIENLESRIVLYSEVKYRGKVRPAVVTVLNMEVNLELVNSNFETLPFYGFRKPHPKDVIQISGWDETTVSPVQSQESLEEEVEEDKTEEEHEESTEEVKESRWAREVRLAAEKIARERRRLYTAEHYLSQLSLTEEEQNEPNDPFRVTDEPWDEVVDDSQNDEAKVKTIIKKVRKKGKKLGIIVHKKEKATRDYRGAPNAFIIELILTHPNFGDRMGSWYLRTLFDQYPDLDYCVLTLPHCYPDFPMLTYFSRLTPRPGKNLNHDVFALHRSVVTGSPGVREGRPSDLPALKHMVRTLQRGKAAMLNELRHAFSPNAPRWLQPFVFTLGETIIGAAVIAEEDDVPSLLAHYEINRHTSALVYEDDDIYCLRVGLMSPIYQKFGQYFLREIMRLSNSGMLFHPVFPFAEEMLSKNDKIPDGPELCPTLLMMEMVPVTPRPYLDVKYDVYPNLAGDTKDVLRVALTRTSPFTLFIANPRLTAMTKRLINLQIVVVGGSETTISFLQHLIYSSTCETTRYTNLTLITPSALPHWAPSPLIDKFLPFVGRYSRLFVSKLGLYIWVNIVIGSVQTIDRENKFVTTTEDNVIAYDMLFLFPGENFSQPYLYMEATGDRCRHYVNEPPGLVSEETPGKPEKDDDEQPINIFCINAEADIIDALTKLARGIRLTAKYTIIVFGHYVALYTCVRGLLEWGVPGENLAVILDRITTKDDNVFGDEKVMKTTEENMLNEGITLYMGWTIRSWQIEDIDKLSTRPEPHIVNVTFWPISGAIVKRIVDKKTEVEDGMAIGPQSINCMGMFCFSLKTIDKTLLDAIFEAGLVFDGRLVVDRLGSTNDPLIKAAGPITRLTRRIPHARDSTLYCSLEHGQKLAERMRRIWDPVERDNVYIRSIMSRSPYTEILPTHPKSASSSTYRMEPSNRTKMANAINAALGPFVKYSSVHPSFSHPIHISCDLPGNRFYYVTKRPGKPSRRKNTEYRTGGCEVGKGPYVRVTVGPGNLITSIFILSEELQPRRTISELYGHHVDTVGPLEGSTSLLDTLLRPEVIAQTVERLTAGPSLSDIETLNSFPHRILLTTTELVLKNNGWKELSTGQIMELRRQFLNSPQQKRLEDRLGKYLEAHGLSLQPEEVRMYLLAILYFTPR